MNENWKFSDIPYHRPDVEALQTRYDALTRRAREAQSPEELVEIVRQRDALQQEVGLCQAVAFIRAFHDVTDEFYQTELQETLPRLEGSLDSQSLAAAIAESPYAPAVDETFGPQLRRLLTLDHQIHAGGKDLQARISQLTAQYQQLTASAKYPVQGELLSGGQLRAALASRDRARRKAAYDAQQQTVLETPDSWRTSCGSWSMPASTWPGPTASTASPITVTWPSSAWAMAGRSWTRSAARCRPISPPCTCGCRRSSAGAWGWTR